MKPTFALNITDEAIGLLHRTSKGWTPVGEVSFAEPDLAEALGYLRKTALGVSPRGITTKLVIPNSQILYAEVEAPGPDEASRLAQIRAGLEGRTPYDVADLVFDWHGTGPVVQVAVVARETLVEAEAFAAEHRLNPMSFVAIPDGDFAGEPFFGPTAHAATQLAAGEAVERDRDAIVIRDRALPKAAPVAAAAPVALDPVDVPPAEPAVVDPAPADVILPVAEHASIAPAPETTFAPEADPTPAPLPEVDEEPLIAFHDTRPAQESRPPVSRWSDKPADPLPEPVYAAPAEWAAVPAPADSVADFLPPVVDTEPAFSAALAAAPSAGEADEAPFTHVFDATPFPEIDEAPAPDVTLDPRKPATDAPDDIPPAPPAAIRMAFASRRAAGDTAGLPPVVATPVAAPPLLNGAAPALGAASATAGRLAGLARPAEADLVRAARGKPIEDLPPMPRPAQAGAKSSGAGQSVAGLARSSMTKGFGALVGPAAGASAKKKKAAAASAAPSSAAMAEARHPAQTLAPNKPLTKPGGTFGARPVQRGKPRYLGLILTAMLLLFLALVAAWSSFYLASGDSGADGATLATETTVPGIDDEMLADEQDPAMLDLAASADPEADLTTVPVEDAMPADAPPAAASPAAATTADSPAAAPPLNEAQDEIFLAAMDTPPPALDALALPAPEARGDAAPDAQAPPPPFGTVYQFDAKGMIQPTPEGILTPEGVMLFAGPPPVVPPQRSAAVVAAAAALAAPAPPSAEATVEAVPLGETPAAAVVAQPAPPPAADPALQGFRPRTRPAALTTAPQDDAAALPDPAATTEAATEAASLLPRARPQAVLAAGAAARAETEGASLAAQAEDLAKAQAAALAAADPANPSLLAISRRPAERPSDLSRAVEAAVAAAIRAPDPAPEPEPEVQLAAAEPAPRIKAPAKAPTRVKEPEATEPEADDEPELAAVPRSSRSLKGTVAKQATFVNAINLSKVNLIGVYGSDSKRYALVRQANGRYKKVRVGDNIDGGKVAAITSSEVRYQKGGRMLSLKLPKS
ncbi:MAG: translation initiation factor 2 [Pseudomonadota bacterium]